MTGLIWTRQNIKLKSGILSIMVGRPRKLGKRERNGRPQRAYVNPRAQVASQPHRNGLPVRFREWPEAETAFGRLLIGHLDASFKEAKERHLLTPARYEAGMRYAELYRGFQQAVIAPGHDPKAMDYRPRIAGEYQGLPDSTAKWLQKAFTEAFNEMARINIAWPLAVMRHAVHDKAIATERERENLARGLDVLVDHFGIDEELKIGRHKSSMQ